MTQEQKDILLKDLCARLPYGIKVEIKYYDDAWELLAIYTNGTTYATRDIGYPIETYFEDCKPYLFPLSSMSEEQEEEISKRYNYHNPYELCVEITNHSEGYWDNDTSCNLQDYLWLENWFNKNHFDYRGLIPMGLANDATGKNIY